MGSILFEHNRKAYVAATSMMERTDRAAVIHPTGTGKSFIAFQLCADNAASKVCLLSPSEYIFMTQLEKWHAAGGAPLENVEFITYARLMRMGEEELLKIQPKYIILDEFHRCGAAQWGEGVKRLLRMYPKAPVLGLSATSIRYLDNQRDMARELFEGNIASELTLGAAVAGGILPAPKYVLSVYAYQKELRRYEMKVKQARSRAVRDAAEKEFEALRRALEKADGLEDVFARHMPVGKYIVFCANYEHLLEMRELAREWFAKVDTAPHIYTAYSDNPATSAEFKAFKDDASSHLKLLYCIDMLNEGIHVDGVDGVILLRPTVSPTIYKQQIGRALASGAKHNPVIFDIVMNIENLCSIGAMEEELREAVFAYREKGRGNEIVTEHFRVVDELGDCRKLFVRLNEILGASWEAMYGMAREYFTEHGNLEVPAAYMTMAGYPLGAWVSTQRKVYTGKTAGSLSREQTARLEAIGMRWQGVQQTAWERNFAEAEKYFREHGDLCVPADYVTQSGCGLGRWVRRQREVYQKLVGTDALEKNIACLDTEPASTVLSKNSAGASGIVSKTSGRKGQSVHMQRMERLAQIGMVWENADTWEERFELAKKYYAEHGDLKIPADYVVEGVWLDRWLREQRARLREEDACKQNVCGEKEVLAEGSTCTYGIKRKLLNAEQKKKLASIGITSGISQGEISWQQQYGEAEAFYREHGNLSIPKRFVGKSGKNLGVWLQHQRAGRRSGQLSSEQVELLNRIGMVWNPDAPWKIGFSHAQEFYRNNGHLAVPNGYICKDGYRLGKWISNQRQAYQQRAGKGLAAEQIRQLEEIGMVWSARAQKQRKTEAGRKR